MESSVDFRIILTITAAYITERIRPSFLFFFLFFFFFFLNGKHSAITQEQHRRIYRRRVTSHGRQAPLLSLEFTRTLITARLEGRRNNEHWVQLNSGTGSQMNRKVDGLAQTVSPPRSRLFAHFSRACSPTRTYEIRQQGTGMGEKERAHERPYLGSTILLA